MCVTLFQAQKSYQDSLKERDEKSLFRKNIQKSFWKNRMRWMSRQEH